MLRVDPSSAAVDAVPADPGPGDAGCAARGLTQRQIARLERLAEIGMDVAEAVGRRARAALDGAAGDMRPDDALSDDALPGDAPGEARHEAALGDLGLAFARVSRAVRLTIALQSRLAREQAGQDQAEAYARRSRIRRIVERAIEAEHTDEDEIERLSEEARERLTEDEDWGLNVDRPFAETVARICADLGLSGAWGADGRREGLSPLADVRPEGGTGAGGAPMCGEPPSPASRVLPPRGEDPGRRGGGRRAVPP